jgi:hypothetical protein
MTPLVEKLTGGPHPVSLVRYRNANEVREATERGVVLVKFTETQGGTELGVWLDSAGRSVEFGDGRIALNGTLTLDYQPVKCAVNVDLDTLTGHGFLEPVVS